MTKVKKDMKRILLRYCQSYLYNIKFFRLGISLLLLIGSSVHTSASTEKSKSLISKFYELAEDKDANVREELAETVGKTGKPEAIKLLEKMATDKDPNVLRAVVKALGQTGRPEALKVLGKIIKNEDKKEKQSSDYNNNIKETAVKAIMEVNKEATSFLAYYSKWKKRKKETDNKKRRYYGYSRMNRLMEKNIYFQIIDRANDKAQAEKQAINLTKQTKEEIFQLLNKLSTDKKENIRRLIAEKALQIESPIKTLKLLEKIINNKDKQPKQASRIKTVLIESIVKIHHQATSFLVYLGNEKEQKEKQKKRHSRYSHRARGDIGIYNQMIQLSTHKKKAENQAIHLANQTKKRALQLLSILAKDKSTRVRIEVTGSIEKLKDPTKVLNLLEKIIKSESKYNNKDKHYTVKRQAIITSIEIYKRANNFLTYLESQTETQTKKKRHSRYSHRARGDIGIYNQMIQLSTHKKKAEKQAIHLANQTKKKILQLLNTLAKDKDAGVRAQVVTYLPVIDNLEAFHLLEKLIKDKNTRVRKAIVKALEGINYIGHYIGVRYNKMNKISEKINATKTMSLLEKLAEDPDKDVRISAIKAMGKLNEN